MPSKTTPRKRILVNRRLFMAWATEGTLLDFKHGKGIVTDHLVEQFEAAEGAMDRGETIYLTDADGTVLTEMKVVGEGDEAGYQETESSVDFGPVVLPGTRRWSTLLDRMVDVQRVFTKTATVQYTVIGGPFDGTLRTVRGHSLEQLLPGKRTKART